MNIEEIFTKLASHMWKGINIHKAMMEAYDFLALKGYSKCQEYHYLEEINDYSNLLHFYMHNYQKLIKVDQPDELNIIPQSWYKYTREDVDANTRRSSVKDLMTKWIDWEHSTKLLYQEAYRELDALNDIAAASFIQDYIINVTQELNLAQQKKLELDAINYDVVEIIDEQSSYYHKYCKKIKKGSDFK